MKRLRARRLAPPLPPELQSIRDRLVVWQTNRLYRTHDDLNRNPRTRPAVRFFLTEVYAPRDFSQRDADLERVSAALSRFLPKVALDYLGQVLEMNVLTDEIDLRMTHVIAEHDDLDVEGLDAATYAEAIRRCDDEDLRRRQIALIWDGGKHLDEIAFKPAVGLTMKMARRPCELAGLGELYHVMQTGFQAFRHLRGAEYFLTTLVTRENEILDRVYAGEDAPFDM